MQDVPEALRSLTRQLRDLRKQLTSGTAPAAAERTEESEPGEQTAASYELVRSCLRESARLLNVAALDVPQRTEALLAELEDLKMRVTQLDRSGVLSADALIERGERVDDVRMVVCETPGANPNLMRQLIDQIRKKAEKSAVLLASAQGSDKVTLVAGLSRTLVDRGFSAGAWVKQVAVVVGGGGGGRPDMAQAGGKRPEQLPSALEEARRLMRDMIAQNRADGS
jgi:alanyl-tRNA synthetase